VSLAEVTALRADRVAFHQSTRCRVRQCRLGLGAEDVHFQPVAKRVVVFGGEGVWSLGEQRDGDEQPTNRPGNAVSPNHRTGVEDANGIGTRIIDDVQDSVRNFADRTNRAVSEG
jgi:hypothetical protein